LEFYVFLSPSFDMWKEEGKGVCFFLNFFFIVEWLGGSGFFKKNMLEGDGRGRGFLFIYLFIFRVLNG